MMNKKQFFLMALALAATSACNAEKLTFEMPVEKVMELKGFVLKGISLSGTVKLGCISNDNQFNVKRNGKVIHTNQIRVLEVANLRMDQTFTGEVYAGERITLYIPDGKKDDIVPGDVVISTASACSNGPVRK
jgi:translation elongation factor EF-1alpha